MAEYEPGPWDLGELVGGAGRRSLEGQVRALRDMTGRFEEAKAALDPGITAERFRGILSDLEAIHERMSIVGGYASLSYAADTQSDEATALFTRMSRLGSEVSNRILFFDLWWKNGADGNTAARLLRGAGELEGYLAHKRLLARHSLSEPEERIINTLEVTGAAALVKIYDKITNAFEYRMRAGGRARTLTREELANHVRSASPGIREGAYRTLLSKYAENSGVVGEIYQNIVLNWRDEGIDIRGYGSPISMRNTGNDVDDGTVESLLAVCRKNSRVFQRFFIRKAGMLGMERLRRYDLYAPASAGARQKRYPYGRAVRMVLESLGRFSPELEGFARRVFSENHVDSEVRKGKRDGAFCSTLGPEITPYVLVNFTGRARDVFTLAHELGHAVHSQAAGGRSILVQEASLPLAETASTFSELLLYDSISGTISDGEKRIMLAEKIDDLYATILRQSFFTVFEVAAHEQIAGGATVDEISGTYMKNLEEQFGRSVDVSEDFAVEWSCIPHFYHTPFYCYAYSFGNLLALSLFRRYKREGKDFVPSYMGILAAGGSKKPEDLLEEHGFDIRSPGFWQDGFDYVGQQVRDLSRLE